MCLKAIIYLHDAEMDTVVTNVILTIHRLVLHRTQLKKDEEKNTNKGYVSVSLHLFAMITRIEENKSTIFEGQPFKRPIRANTIKQSPSSK